MKLIKILILILFISSTNIAFSAYGSHNLLPQMPQIVFDKASTSDFYVEELEAICELEAYTAQTNLKVKLKNVSNNKIELPVKFRILYPTNMKAISIKFGEKNIKYNPESPIASLSLNIGQSIDIEIKAKVSTDYSVNSLKKALAAQEKQKKSKLQTIGESFARFFNQEVYGKRFMIGVLVSKWGIFPVEIKKSKIEVSTSDDIILITEKQDIWEQSKIRNGKKFICSQNEGFETAVFLPAKDEKEFKEHQELIKQQTLKNNRKNNY